MARIIEPIVFVDLLLDASVNIAALASPAAAVIVVSFPFSSSSIMI